MHQYICADQYLQYSILIDNPVPSNIDKPKKIDDIFKELLTPFFNCFNRKGLKLITRLRLGLSHLRDHKFKHSFQYCLKPICSCGTDVETTAHYLLHCPNYLHERKTLLDNSKSVLPNILEKSESFINNVLLFGDTSLDDSSNTIILNAKINYITSTKRFYDPIFMF